MLLATGSWRLHGFARLDDKINPGVRKTLAELVARSVPELGMLTDQGTAGRGIVVRLSDQKAFLYNRGELVAVSPASTGREGYNTPRASTVSSPRTSITGRVSMVHTSAMAGSSWRVWM